MKGLQQDSIINKLQYGQFRNAYMGFFNAIAICNAAVFVVTTPDEALINAASCLPHPVTTFQYTSYAALSLSLNVSN
jgi:hypothetical protein